MFKSNLSRVLTTLRNLNACSISRVLPLIMVLSGLSTVFFFGNNRMFLYRDILTISRNENWLSSLHMTIAINLSPTHHFLMFTSRGFDIDGNIDYTTYNRFPPGGYALIKLVTLPFGDNLSSQLYAARMLMILLFLGIVILIYLSLVRLISNRWVASTTTLIVSSTLLFLLYIDTIITEVAPELLGFALTFHGLVVFTQEGRFRQLIIKACLALLLGWHVLAMLSVFILLSLTKEIIKIGKAKTAYKVIITVVTSQYFMLGIIVLGFGVMILAYNIGNEYYALNFRGNHQLALSDLPSFNSMLRRTSLLRRTGLGEQFANRMQWIPFIENQFQRISFLSVPFILSSSNMNWIRAMTGLQEFHIGIVVVGACVIGVFLVRHRLLAATAVLSGFCWMIPMHNQVTPHPFEGLYFLSIPLFFFALFLLAIRKWSSERLMPFASVIALGIFISSSYQISRDSTDDLSVRFQETLVDDFDVIRQFARGRNIFVPITDTYEGMIELVGVRYGLHYYLSGSGIMFNNYGCDRGLDKVDLLIQARRDIVSGLLTPNNQMVFLYDRYVYEKRIDKVIEKYSPLIRGDFDVYLTDDRKLVYVSDRCDGIETESLFLGAPIFLDVYPVDVEDISDPSQGYEFNSFDYVDHFVLDTKRHVVIIDLPDYDIASISTGQYTADGRIWGGSFFGPDYATNVDLVQYVDRATASRQPVIRDRFDVYLMDDRSLIYVREPCHDSDIGNNFFVHISPVYIGDIPEHRQQYKFDNLDFTFVDHGTKDGRRCVAEIKLPDYDIASISTGQYTGKDRIWQNRFGVADG